MKFALPSVVSSVACFARGHRTIYQEHIQTLDLHFRKFCRSIVGPPPYTDWTLEWHEILHAWNERAAHFVGVAKIQSWSRICCVSYWALAAHIAKRPIHHWIQRILHWQPVGQMRLGRPKHRWESKLEMRYIFVTKDWFIGRKQHKIGNCGNNI